MKKYILPLLAVLLCLPGVSTAAGEKGTAEEEKSVGENGAAEEEKAAGIPLIYRFAVKENIMPSTVRLVNGCLDEARDMKASYVVLELNTYGGLLESADSIRTRLLRSPVPVVVFIDNQAASAGALISLAADSIFMTPDASIGAATVVDNSGDVLPDKYQSFMRGVMRATAESHGKVAESIDGGDTVWRWRRDPHVAEAMVDPSIEVEGLVGPDKVVTLTAEEAEAWGFSEGRYSSVGELCEYLSPGAEVYEYRPTAMDRVMGFLTNPVFQGLMIMLIVGGIYFELQTPGVGFPLAAAVAGALLYFAPLYVEGLAANWELLLFILGIVLVMVEIFVTPGFGVPGIAGIAAIVVGLTFALMDTDLLRFVWRGELDAGVVLMPLCTVVVSVTVGLVASMWLGKRFLTGHSELRERVVLTTEMTPDEGFVSHAVARDLRGEMGMTTIPLRPGGKVAVEGAVYEAASIDGTFVDRGARVVVKRCEGGVLYVEPVENDTV